MKIHNTDYFVWDFWTDNKEEKFYLVYEVHDKKTHKESLRLIEIKIKL